MTFRACVSLIVLCGWATVALGEDVVSVGTVTADPKSYHSKEVVLRGKVQNVVQLPPYRTRSLLCWGTYTFTLQDSTGSVAVFVQGPCSINTMNPDVKPPQVTEGEEVTMEALIFVGDYMSGLHDPNGKATAVSKEFRK